MVMIGLALGGSFALLGFLWLYGLPARIAREERLKRMRKLYGDWWAE